MHTLLRHVLLACLLTLAAASSLVAQDLAVTNVRIIVGTGQVIEQGTILVRGGRIVSASAGDVAAPGVPALDGRGLTAIAGYIDAHRHIVPGGRGAGAGGADAWLRNDAPTRMREFLDAGYTTLMSAGGAAEPVVALRKAIADGQMAGPRIIPSAPLQLGQNPTPEAARELIRRMAAADIHFTGEVNVNSFMPDPRQLAALAAAIDEGKKVGVDVAIHAASVVAMRAAVGIGVPKLVHTPHFEWLSDADAQLARAAGTQVSSCTGFGAPVFNVFNQENVPTFRDGGKWPDAIIDGEGRGREAGYKAVNGRTLFDNGVVYGYCTDTGYLPAWGLAQELRVLGLMFSPVDLVKVLGPNSASWVNMADDLGTLEAGKIADIVLLGGNPLGGTPLNGYWDFLNVQVTIKGGSVLVDKRASR
ncbi:MAG: amidohydrolase family protein [Acidobacteria bacterium]|nr:amidohydrolase family protein [Acidobacteriota bacterium]